MESPYDARVDRTEYEKYVCAEYNTSENDGIKRVHKIISLFLSLLIKYENMDASVFFC